MTDKIYYVHGAWRTYPKQATQPTSEELALWLNSFGGGGDDPEHDSDGEESEAEFELMDIG
jgi:hypothetical protein